MKRSFRCSSCGHWHEAPDGICPTCGPEALPSHAQMGAPLVDHRTPNPFEMPLPTWIKDPSIPAPVRFMKNSVVALQWVAMFFAGSIAWMAYWVAV